MKKKIALLLAAMITIVTPMNAFAAASYSHGGGFGNTGQVQNIPAGTLFPQVDLFTGGLQAINTSSAIIKDQGVDYIIRGTDMIINLASGDTIKNGDTFNISLNNAHFWFAEDQSSNYDRYISLGAGKTTFEKDPSAVYGSSHGYGTTIPGTPTPGKYAVNTTQAPMTVAETSGRINVYNDLQYTLAHQTVLNTATIAAAGDVAAASVMTVDPSTDIASAYTNSSGASQEFYIGYYIRYANNAATGGANATITFIVNVDGDGVTSGGDIYGYGNKATAVRIPMVIKSMNEKDIIAKVYAGATTAVRALDGEEFKISAGIAATGTDVTTSIVNTSRETTPLGTINIVETAPGVLGSGYFELALNEGFVFNGTNMSVTSSNSAWATATFQGYSRDRKTAYFRTTVTSPSTGLGGYLIINGAEVSRTTDYYNFVEDTATITIRSLVNNESITAYPFDATPTTTGTPLRVTGNANISTKTISVAIFRNYGLAFGFDNTTEKAVVTYAGRENVVTPRLRLQESAANSWWTDRTTRFTLTDKDGNILESAKIAKVVVSGLDNLTYGSDTYAFSEDTQVGYNPYYTFNRGYIELRDIRRTSNYRTAKMNIQFIINTAANYSGEVYVSVSGLGIDPDIEIEPIKIADVKAPVYISTQSTEVAIGYQTYKTADVTITEDTKGVLRAGKVFSLEVDEFANTGNVTSGDISFNPINSGDVEMTSGTTLAFNKVTLGGNRISFAISKPSTREAAPGVFTVKNLHVKINRSVPYGNYDLIAGGSAIAETYRQNATESSAFFPVKGVVYENYVKVATAGDTKSLAKNVVLTPGSSVATVDTRETTVDPAPYINEVGRIMIPLRAVSTLFDIPQTDVIWDPTTGTATIVLAGTTSSRIITFTNKSSVMTINGVPVAMVDENGVATTAEIAEATNRMYIPLRQLGIAFGIRVEWDGTHAIFNPTTTQIGTL